MPSAIASVPLSSCRLRARGCALRYRPKNARLEQAAFSGRTLILWLRRELRQKSYFLTQAMNAFDHWSSRDIEGSPCKASSGENTQWTKVGCCASRRTMLGAALKLAQKKGCGQLQQFGSCATILTPPFSIRASQSSSIHRSPEIPEQKGSGSPTESPLIRKRTSFMRDLELMIGHSKLRFTCHPADTTRLVAVLSKYSLQTGASLTGRARSLPDKLRA